MKLYFYNSMGWNPSWGQEETDTIVELLRKENPKTEIKFIDYLEEKGRVKNICGILKAKNLPKNWDKLIKEYYKESILTLSDRKLNQNEIPQPFEIKIGFTGILKEALSGKTVCLIVAFDVFNIIEKLGMGNFEYSICNDWLIQQGIIKYIDRENKKILEINS